MLPLTHNLISGVVVLIGGDLAAVSESDVLARVASEVKDDFPPFSIGDVQVLGIDRVESESSVGGKHCHGNLSADGIAGLKVELIGSADTSIQEAHTVLARLDLVEWPWDAVDVNDITVQTGRLAISLGVPETAIGIVTFRSKSKRQIVFAGRKIKPIFLGIRQDVEASLSVVSVLCSVVDSVVMVPQSTSVLSVGVVVVFVLSWFCSIVGPAIKWGSTV